MVRICAAIGLGCLGACFTPDVQPCAVNCSATGGCPPNLVCLADNFCHAAPSESLCSTSNDAAVLDADVELPDADPLAPDADPNPPTPTLAGQLVITEIMKDPCVDQGGCTVADTDGEWFEIHNPTSDPFDLDGLLFHDDSGQQFLVTSPLIIDGGAHLVFGINGNVGTNGGAPVDFVYPPAFILSNNSADAIEIVNVDPDPDVTIDRVAWNTAGFPSGDRGDALNLSPTAYDATSNDAAANWCDAPNSFGAGDNGSPGAMNPACP